MVKYVAELPIIYQNQNEIKYLIVQSILINCSFNQLEKHTV